MNALGRFSLLVTVPHEVILHAEGQAELISDTKKSFEQKRNKNIELFFSFVFFVGNKKIK